MILPGQMLLAYLSTLGDNCYLKHQFHMDIDYIQEFPLANKTVTGYGTYFHDQTGDRYAAFMIYPPTSTSQDDDYFVIKYIYVKGSMYQLDLATGECQSKGHNRPHIPWLPTMKYDGIDYLKRNGSFYPVSTWQFDQQVATMFGNVGVGIKYHHSLGKISPPDSSNCHKIPHVYSANNVSAAGNAHKGGKNGDLASGEPFRLEITSLLPALVHPVAQSTGALVTYDLSCFIPSFKDTDTNYVFDIPKHCDYT